MIGIMSDDESNTSRYIIIVALVNNITNIFFFCRLFSKTLQDTVKNNSPPNPNRIGICVPYYYFI